MAFYNLGKLSETAIRKIKIHEKEPWIYSIKTQEFMAKRSH